RRLAAELRLGELTAAVRDHLVHVHVELRSAAGHPYVKRKHVVMLAGENLVTRLNDELVGLGVESFPGVIGVRGRLLQRRVRGDHLARDQVVPDAEVLERALRLGSPQSVGRDVHLAQTVEFSTYRAHERQNLPSSVSPCSWNGCCTRARITNGSRCGATPLESDPGSSFR